MGKAVSMPLGLELKLTAISSFDIYGATAAASRLIELSLAILDKYRMTIQITDHCYRYHHFRHGLDPEQIWRDVQAWGGFLSIQPGGDIDFFVPDRNRVFFEIKYPELSRSHSRSWV